MGILTFVFWIFLIIVIVAMIIAMIGAGAMAALFVGFIAVVVKSIEQVYYWYIGEPFEILWIIGGVFLAIVMILSKKE